MHRDHSQRGEWRHLHANAELAHLTGVPRENIVLAENGSVVDLVDGKVGITGEVPVGFVYVDGSSVGDITESQLKDRRILGDEGFISVFVVVDVNSGKVVTEPEIHERGFAQDDEIFNEVRPMIRKALEEALSQKTKEERQLQQVVRRTVGQWVSRSHRRRPMILPVVVKV